MVAGQHVRSSRQAGPRGLRRVRTALIAALAIALPLGLAPPAVASGAQSGDPATASDSATAPGTAQVPMAATFAYHAYGEAGGQLIHGAIHAVVRIPGGTAVFFSIGGPGAQPGAVDPCPHLDEDYNLTAFRSVAAIDTQGLKRYQPLLLSGGTCACTDQGDLSDYDGTKVPEVGYAVLPQLPAAVKTVTIEFGFGTLIPNVPITDTLPQPTATGTPVVLGHGWPQLPNQDELEQADPKKVTRPLVRHTASKTATTNDRSDSTEVALNSDVLFDTDKSTLRADAKDAVAQVARKLAGKGSGTVKVTGYTDSTGGTDHNVTLSKQRAKAVVTALKSQVSKTGLAYTAASKGEADPVATNDTADGRQQNRRVTVAFATNGGK